MRGLATNDTRHGKFIFDTLRLLGIRCHGGRSSEI
jgi:hypothetical protein